MHRFPRALFLLFALAALAGCATTRALCTRLDVERDGACVPIAVHGVTERAITFEGGGGIELQGTLSIPDVDPGVLLPGVVLVHGSGPNDRDETTPGNLLVTYEAPVKTFALLAAALSQRGFVVLRYDKRTCFVENSDGRCTTRIADAQYDLASHVASDLIDDAAGAIRALAGLPETRDDDVVVIGHSEGGNFVAPVLAREPAASAGVLLAAPAISFDAASVRQLRVAADFLEARDGVAFAENIAAFRAAADEDERAYAAIRAGTFEGAAHRGVPVSYWLSTFAATDEIEPQFRGSARPMLALFGSTDFNVDLWHHAEYARWITEGAHPASRAALIPDATHSFVSVNVETNAFDPAFSPRALEELFGFLDDPATGAERSR